MKQSAPEKFRESAPEMGTGTSAVMDSRSILLRIWQGWVRRYLGRLLAAFAMMAVVAGTASAYPF